MYRILLIFLLSHLNVNCYEIDFLLFENHELTKASFIEEQEIYKNLRKVRQHLDTQKDKFHLNKELVCRQYSVADQNSVSHDCKSFKIKVMERIKNSLHSDSYYFHNINEKYNNNKIENNYTFSYEDVYQTIGKTNILKAALKGVLMLQETYVPNIENFASGNLSLKSVALMNSRLIDSLDHLDLAMLSKIAFNELNWFDSAIKLLRAAIDMFYNIRDSVTANYGIVVDDLLSSIRSKYSLYHNEMASKVDNPVGPDWKVYPYPVDEGTLQPVTNDTLEQVELKALHAIRVDRLIHKGFSGQMRLPLFQNVCNKKIKGIGGSLIEAKINMAPKCHFLHHHDPFMIIGPFNLEVKLYSPFRTIIHGFFTKKEMDWMIDFSKPRLTIDRRSQLPRSTSSLSLSEIKQNSHAYTVAKTITTWFSDIEYDEKQRYTITNPGFKPMKVIHPPLDDPYSYSVKQKEMIPISKRIEIATGLNVTSRHGAQDYQTTGYGLSGMVEEHRDPWGYEQGEDLVEDRINLSRSGDYIATFMGWITNTEAGGGTAFTKTGSEGLLEPTEGSAAFWINLSSCHRIDMRTRHGGCPVLKGQKWILNKWIYSWDQWRRWPCFLSQYASIPPFFGISK